MPQREMESESSAVQLQPFVHQVGGHSSVLCFDIHTLCKPLVPREHHFYKTMPEEMKEFTPKYRGVVEVTVQENHDGYMTLVAHPVHASTDDHRAGHFSGNSPSSGGDTAQSDSDSESSSSEQPKQRVHLKRRSSIEEQPPSKMMFELKTDKGSQKTSYNPWSLHCHRQTIDRMKRMDTDSGSHKFILLENLTSLFKFPCILDLKMGTRQHGDDSTEEKRRLHMLKCEKSTSRLLGTRICGMQVFQSSTGRFLCHDKYYGRKLTEEGFHQTLHQFLHDGKNLREDLLAPIISRLEQLHNTLSDQDTFRFYSSSLLIMYDGSPRVDNDRPPPPQTNPATSHDATLASDSTQGYCSKDYFVSDGSSPSGGAPNKAFADSSPSSHHSPRTNRTDSAMPLVDIRMIDFAHATHQGFYRDQIVHAGPDRGYLLGLKTLIKAFCKLKCDGRSSEEDELS